MSGARLTQSCQLRWRLFREGRGGDFERAYLGCVAEAARRAGSRRSQESARSRLQEAGAIAIRKPLIAGRPLASRLGVSTRARLDLAARLAEAGVLREMTGRAAWRAFAIT